MNKNLFIASFLISFLLLSGCATVSYVPISKQNSQSIKSVYINPEIKKPEKMYEFASGSELGMAFGAIGGLISGAANAQAATDMQSFAEQNHIDIRSIVYQQWKNQMTAKSRFKLSTQPTDTILKTTITLYGISIPHGFSRYYVPVLAMHAKLIRNNAILWQENGSVLTLGEGMPRYKMKQIIKDPQKLYLMWDKASEKLINKMIMGMNK